METAGYTFGLRFFSDLNSQDESLPIGLSRDVQGPHGYFKKWGCSSGSKWGFWTVRIILMRRLWYNVYAIYIQIIYRTHYNPLQSPN